MYDLFEPIELSQTLNQMAIDNAIVRYKDFHPIYVCMGINKKYRDKINNRWNSVKNLCEKDFYLEFRRPDNFYSRMWELNLRYCLRDAITRKPRVGEPDILGKDYVIECVVPKPIDIPKMTFDGVERDYPTDQIARRVTKAFGNKKEQLDRRLSSAQIAINYAKTAYVIGFGLPWEEFQGSKSMSGLSIVESLMMGAGNPRIIIDANGTFVKSDLAPMPTMLGSSGQSFDVAYFQHPEYKNVSAVLWSEQLVPEIDDLTILKNPLATINFKSKNLGLMKNTITYRPEGEVWKRNKKNK